MEMRDIVHSIKADHAHTLKRVAEETAELKQQWDQQTTALAAKMQEFEAALERHQGDVRSLGQQRLDDLDLVEKALSTVQQQQARMRSTVEERVEAGEWTSGGAMGVHARRNVAAGGAFLSFSSSSSSSAWFDLPSCGMGQI